MKKLLTILCAAILLVGLLTVSASATTETSGTCGDNVTWSLDSGTLTISGTGEMTDYGIRDQPWYDSRSIITDVIIENGVTTICNYAFYRCTALTEVSIQGNIQLGRNAFSGCSAFSTLNFGNGVTEIDTDFFSISSLTTITVDPQNTVYSAKNSVLYNQSGTTLVRCFNKTGSFTIPSGVTSISSYAFSGCTGLTSVSIPDSVTTIGDYAFYGCTSLTSVTIPNSVTSIGSDAFSDCISLTSVTIPNSVTAIGRSAFYWCTSLTSVTIPNSVTSIGNSAFYGCTSLASVTIPSSVRSIAGYAFSGCTNLTSVTIPNSVTSIGSDAFSDCTSLTSVTIPNSVTSIAGYAFSGCTNLTSVTIPNSVKTIDSYAFSRCTNLTSITIPNSVTSIGNYTFSGCTNLASVTIPDSVATIGKYAFSGCTRLTSVVFPDRFTYYYDYSTGQQQAFYIGCASISFNAFSGCTGLTSVTFEGSVSSIATEVFDGCTSLETVTFAGTVGTIGESSFRNCGLTSLILPEGETAIEGHAFRYCSNLKLAYLPAGTQSIGNYAFSDTALTDIYYGGSVEQWETLLATGSSQFPEDVTVHYNSDGIVYDLTAPTIKVTNRASDGKPYISWDTVNGAGGYEVWYCGTKTGTYKLLYTAKADKLSVTHTGAAVGNDYFYKVRATSGDVQSEFSSIKGVWVDLKCPTIKVTNNTSSGKPVISWNKMSYATGYKVYCATGSSTGPYKLIYSTTNPDKLSVTHIGAEAGEAYFYKVVAVHKNSKCNSAYSTAKGVYCDLARPTLTVTLNSNGKPYLSWTNSAGADSYKVYRSYDGNSWTLMYTAKSNDLDVNHTGAKADTTYYYRVIAICNTTSKANSSYSAVKMITTE